MEVLTGEKRKLGHRGLRGKLYDTFNAPSSVSPRVGAYRLGWLIRDLAK